jgi:hypothetical protein
MLVMVGTLCAEIKKLLAWFSDSEARVMVDI